MSNYENEGLNELKPELLASIEKGLAFKKKSWVIYSSLMYIRKASKK